MQFNPDDDHDKNVGNLLIVISKQVQFRTLVTNCSLLPSLVSTPSSAAVSSTPSTSASSSKKIEAANRKRKRDRNSTPLDKQTPRAASSVAADDQMDVSPESADKKQVSFVGTGGGKENIADDANKSNKDAGGSDG